MLPWLKTEWYNPRARDHLLYALKPRGGLKGPLKTFLDAVKYANLTEMGEGKVLKVIQPLHYRRALIIAPQIQNPHLNLDAMSRLHDFTSKALEIRVFDPSLAGRSLEAGS
jgi:hypothetical protein